MTKRNTIQKEIVLNTVTRLKSHVTADEVYEEIKKDYPSISRGTVYRNLKVLYEEGKIRKVIIPYGSDRFDFTTAEHYHVICVKCNKVMDIEMDFFPDLYSLIHSNDNMKIIGYDILFNGICSECMKKDKEG